MPGTKLSRFSLKRNSVKMFLFFLAFTSLLWLFVQFSKNYTQEIEIGIDYINIPEGKLLNPNSDRSLKLILSGNGFRFINYSWEKPILKFDLQDAVAMSDTSYHFLMNNKDLILKEKLNFEGTVLAIQKDTLKVKLDPLLERKIPVLLEADIQYAPGYGSDQGVQISPDSIALSGPYQVIDTIRFIRTNTIKLEDLNSDYTVKLPLYTQDFPEAVKVFTSSVQVHIEVSKFTEGNQEIPIDLINVPDGKSINIFPKKVKVVYRVGLKQYDNISQQDFKIVADYKKASEDSSYLILELVTIPESIHDVRLHEKQVQFVILTQDEN